MQLEPDAHSHSVWMRLKKPSFLIYSVPLIALLLKIYIAFQIEPVVLYNGFLQGGGWLGADGENYLQAASGLQDSGIFSNEPLLTYWPAGYSIFLWLASAISDAHVLWLVSITQSALYAFGSFYFLKQLNESRLAKYLLAISLVLALNPTLSMATLVVGYEGFIAGFMLLLAGVITKYQSNPSKKRLFYSALLVGISLAVTTFMQPRWLLTTLAISIIWAVKNSSRKDQAVLLAIVIGVMSVAPATLVIRNHFAGKGSVISTNLGVTMKIGAGDETSGSYAHKGPEVPCEPIAPATTVSDNEIVKCVIKWYAGNPSKAVKLFINKSIYFWSPWSGPLQNGTMARNPWHLFNPLENMSAKSQQGHDLVYGSFGKAISWAWLLGGISLFFIGFFWLRSLKGQYSLLAWLLAAPVMVSWLIGMGTIGDHRFRIPTMSLSLVLQVLGIYALKKKALTGTFAHAE